LIVARTQRQTATASFFPLSNFDQTAAVLLADNGL